MTSSIKNIRNIGIMAHIDAGKTTTTERILFYTKKIHKIGEIDDGAATMDFMDQEQERGITIQSAATTCYWGANQINIIDTPGHVDFTAEVERSLRVLDGAILVLSAVDGVQAQTQTVWHQANSFNVPRIVYVNKMDRVGADYFNAIADVTKKFKTPVISLQLPVGQGEEFSAIIDLLTMKELHWDDSDNGATIKECEIADSYKSAAQSARDKLIDTAASYDDSLGEKYLNGDAITNEDLVAAIRRAVISQKVVASLLGSSRHNIGVQPLLDAVVKYLPAPTDVSNHGTHLKKGKAESDVVIESDDTKPLAALLFKVQYNKDAGYLCYVRVYSGKITTGSQLLNARTQKRERVNRILRMNADKMEQMTQVSAGDIAVLIGPKDSATGDTFTSEGFPVLLEKPQFPEPVITSSIECENLSERQKLSDVLKIMAREDPTFLYKEDESTGQLVISGMGELHLDVLVTRMQRDFLVKCKTGNPRVTYREGVSGSATESVTYSKLINAKQTTATVTLMAQRSDTSDNIYECAVNDKSIPSFIYDTIETTIRANFTSGIKMGYPCSALKITLKDLVYSAELSTEFAFAAATAECFDKVCNLAGPVMLEPVMAVEVTCPVDKMGEASSVLIARGGIIMAQNERNGAQVISAQSPMSKMFGFATALRSATGGMAEFSMEFSHFQEKV